MPKHDRHGLGYQPNNQSRNEQMGRQRGNRMANSRLTIPPIHQTFKSRGYINSNLSMEDEDVVTPFFAFTINATTENEETTENVCPTVYPSAHWILN